MGGADEPPAATSRGPGSRDHAAAGDRRSRPVEPPAGFVDELESRLADVQAAALEALEELSDWELDAMRDPRNWVRPAAALAVGTAAGTALVRAPGCAAPAGSAPAACAASPSRAAGSCSAPSSRDARPDRA